MIFVLDDHPGVLVAFGGVLKRMAVPFGSAPSIAKAMEALPLHAWTAFIVDLELPDGSGVDLLEWIRSHTHWRHIPAAVITANILIHPEIENRIYAAGATLHCGALTRLEIEDICRGLLNMGGHRSAERSQRI